MRRRAPEDWLAKLMLWMWLGIVIVVIAGYRFVRWWHRRHPSHKQEPERPYAQQLQHRLKEQRTARKRSKPPKG